MTFLGKATSFVRLLLEIQISAVRLSATVQNSTRNKYDFWSDVYERRTRIRLHNLKVHIHRTHREVMKELIFHREKSRGGVRQPLDLRFPEQRHR